MLYFLALVSINSKFFENTLHSRVVTEIFLDRLKFFLVQASGDDFVHDFAIF